MRLISWTLQSGSEHYLQQAGSWEKLRTFPSLASSVDTLAAQAQHMHGKSEVVSMPACGGVVLAPDPGQDGLGMGGVGGFARRW
jgi:hypothetical protein